MKYAGSGRRSTPQDDGAQKSTWFAAGQGKGDGMTAIEQTAAHGEVLGELERVVGALERTGSALVKLQEQRRGAERDGGLEHAHLRLVLACVVGLGLVLANSRAAFAVWVVAVLLVFVFVAWAQLQGRSVHDTVPLSGASRAMNKDSDSHPVESPRAAASPATDHSVALDAQPKMPARHNAHRLPDLRAVCAATDPVAASYLTDEYLLSVMDQESSKDASVKRTFEYAARKLCDALAEREHFSFLKYEFAAAAGVAPRRPVELTRALQSEAYYFYGYTFDGRPIIWFHACKRDRSAKGGESADTTKMQVMLVMEAVARLMPANITSFVLVGYMPGASSKNIQVSAEVAVQKLLIRCFPDRLSSIYLVGPGLFVRAAFRLARPLLPRRFASKLHMVAVCDASKVLGKVMPCALVPDYMGGPCVHTHRGDFDAAYERQARQLAEWQLQGDECGECEPKKIV